MIAAVVALSGCGVTPAGDVPSRQATAPTRLPPMKAFSGTQASAPTRANSLIATDFLDLSFQLESGRALPVLSRFETPVSLRVTGNAPAHLGADLKRLLSRLRSEAGINIRRVSGTRAASITVEVITKAKLKSLVPHAACFVVPNVSSWEEFKRERRSPKTDWTQLTTRTRMAVFLPGDVSPQEMRDCLHEEIAQALGPVNDLYRLNNSVFNDDNFNTILTGFDMLILRAYYAPDLSSGMTREQVAAVLPGILERLNPAGGSGQPAFIPPTLPAWTTAIQTALGASGSGAHRRAAADRAVSLAYAQGWRDTRLALSYFAVGRLNMGADGHKALEAFRKAEAIYSASQQTRLQAAHMGVQLAAYALSSGRPDQAIAIVNTHIPPVLSAENAVLLSTLLMIKAQALDLAGHGREARLVRLDSLGWARYGFGTDAQVGARLAEIAAIAPKVKG